MINQATKDAYSFFSDEIAYCFIDAIQEMTEDFAIKAFQGLLEDQMEEAFAIADHRYGEKSILYNLSKEFEKGNIDFKQLFEMEKEKRLEFKDDVNIAPAL